MYLLCYYLHFLSWRIQANLYIAQPSIIQPFMSKTYQELTIQSQMTLKTIIHLQMFSPSYGYYFMCNR
jgi:hypothetical protein